MKKYSLLDNTVSSSGLHLERCFQTSEDSCKELKVYGEWIRRARCSSWIRTLHIIEPEIDSRKETSFGKHDCQIELSAAGRFLACSGLEFERI